MKHSGVISKSHVYASDQRTVVHNLFLKQLAVVAVVRNLCNAFKAWAVQVSTYFLLRRILCVHMLVLVRDSFSYDLQHNWSV